MRIWRRNRTGLAVSMMGLLLAGMLWVLAGCSDDDPVSGNGTEPAEKVRIAVVLPLGQGKAGWTRVLEWAKENIRRANDVVVPEYEFYDEDAVDVGQVAATLAVREDIAAVIGCYSSVNTEKLARECARTYKPVFTFSTSAELPRAFGQRGFLWMLSESDITQSELLLLKAAGNGAEKVALLASDDIYGQTFIDWFDFQAVELGMEAVGSECYTPSGLSGSFARAIENHPDYLICAPGSVEQACAIVRSFKESNFRGRLLFSDMAYSDRLIPELGLYANNVEGIALASDPGTGFDVSYQAYFGERPGLGEAAVYDAVMIACYASRYAAVHGMEMDRAVAALLRRGEKAAAMWTQGGMRQVFRGIEQGETPLFSGASGDLDFVPENYTSVLYSTFVHWMVYEDAFLHLDYNTRPEKGGSSMYAAWEWNKKYMQDFDPEERPQVVYPPRTGNRAVVVAASEGWMNYRHQADALAFYRLLKENGYDDEHIVLIMADDIARHANNPEPGVIRRTEDGVNLYEDVEVDYRLQDLTMQDLQEVICGRDPRTGKVVGGEAGASGENVLLFWSGHGVKGSLVWGDGNQVSAEFMAQTMRRMSDAGAYRKLLCFFETCYSGSVARKCCGIPGVLMFTAANAGETSKADVYNTDLNVWMTNRFTSVLLEQCRKNPDITLRELYSTMFHRTLGSHVSVYNADHYGNVYLETMSEFLKPLSK